MIIQIASSGYCHPLGILICVPNKKMLSDASLTDRQVICAIMRIKTLCSLDCCRGVSDNRVNRTGCGGLCNLKLIMKAVLENSFLFLKGQLIFFKSS